MPVSYTHLDVYKRQGITKDVLQNAMEEGPQYARLLAFNDRGRQWLRNEYEIPLIQKWAKAPNELSALGQTMHHIDTLATDILSLIHILVSVKTVSVTVMQSAMV